MPGSDRATDFLIWGGGGHGRVVADVVRAAGGTVLGFIDQDPDRLGGEVEPGGARVVMLESDWVARTDAVDTPALAWGIGRNALRYRKLQLAGSVTMPVLVHPSAVVSPSARLGRGTVVCPRAVINALAVAGEAVIVNTGAIVEHDCTLGDAVHVSPGAILAGGVHVAARSWIGAGAVVIEGVSIGADAVVGAGAVVLRDVPAGARVVGNPARLLPAADDRGAQELES